MASFMMGQMTQAVPATVVGPTKKSNSVGHYELPIRILCTDNWKVTPKLTLNLGLRYDVTLPRTDRFNHQDYFDTNAPVH